MDSSSWLKMTFFLCNPFQDTYTHNLRFNPCQKTRKADRKRVGEESILMVRLTVKIQFFYDFPYLKMVSTVIKVTVPIWAYS